MHPHEAEVVSEELTDEQLDAVSGGSWISDLAKALGKKADELARQIEAAAKASGGGSGS